MEPSVQSASELASQCLSKFDKCFFRKVLSHKQWAENRRADFNLWVDGVGALAGSKASLDARFELRPRELILTKNLLLRLRTNLTDCLAVPEGDALEKSKRNVDAAIENLALIAVAIRQTGRKSRLSKADRNFDPSSLDDLKKHLECVVLIRPTLPEEQYERHHEDDPLWWKQQIDKELTPLQRRLVEANLRRRNRFLYAQKHSQKLASRSPPVPSAQEQNLNPCLPDTEGLVAAVEQEIVQPTLENSGASNTSPLGSSSALSGTSASIPESGLRWKKRHQVIQAPKTQISSITGAADYPKLLNPQKPSDRAIEQWQTTQPKMLKCPCCCEALPVSMLENETAWRKHLSTDVCPYTCIAEDCPTPHVLYRTRAEWEDHLKQHHQKKWKCQLCANPEDAIFISVGILVKHVSLEHAETFPEQLLDTVRLWPSNPSIGLELCPLCHSTGPRDAPTLIDHVLDHTHDFALRSLPWADIPIEHSRSWEISSTYDLSYLQLSKPLDPTVPLSPWLLYVWLKRLDIPESDRQTQSQDVVLELEASRTMRKSGRQQDYFDTNDYFASAADDLSLDIQSDHTRSLKSLGALYDGYEEIIQMLLDEGADVNAQGSKYSNALQAASYSGDARIVQTLLSMGADVNTQGGEYGNALQAASYNGHARIVQTLLSMGADVNAQGGEYGNALQAALHNGHKEIFQMLLGKGADVNAQGGEYSNALQAASHNGHKEIFQMLMSHLRIGIEIAVVCALPLEFNTASLAFDEIWGDDGNTYRSAVGDLNIYENGRIGQHNVVLVLLPNIDRLTAARATASLRISYPGLRLAIFTGICSGVPSSGTDNEIILGDVIVSKTVVQYDYARKYPGKFIHRNTTGDDRGHERLKSGALLVLNKIRENTARRQDWEKYIRPSASEDRLFKPEYQHKHRNQSDCSCVKHACEVAQAASCNELHCDTAQLVPRERLNEVQELERNSTKSDSEFEIHIGNIGSSDMIMKSGEYRDRIAREHGIIAFETNAADMWDQMPCIFIKGVCDYADGHKSKMWQAYATATATSVMKALLTDGIQTDEPVGNRSGAGASPTSFSGSGLYQIKSFLSEYGIKRAGEE